MNIDVAGLECEVIESLPGHFYEVRKPDGHLAVADIELQKLSPPADFGGIDRLFETCARKARHCDE